MNNKKHNNKLLIIVSLLIIVISGIIGYGIFAYRYTDSTIQSSNGELLIKTFNPSIYNEYLGGSHESINSIECDLSSYDSNEKIASYSCRSEDSIENLGSKPLEVSISNIQGHCSNCDYNIHASCNDKDYCDYEIIEPGSNVSIYFSITLNLYNLDIPPESQDNGQETVISSPLYGNDYSFYITYYARAEEVD